MSNTLTALVPKIFGQSLPSLRNAAKAVQVCRTDFKNEVAQKGDTIDMPVPVTSGTAAVAPGVYPEANTDQIPTTKQIALSSWRRSNKVALTAKEMAEIDGNDFKNSKIYEQTIALIEEMNAAVLLGMKNASYYQVGTAGTTPFGTSVLQQSSINVRRALSLGKAPVGDRHLILGPSAEAAALGVAAISDASLRGNSGAKDDGSIGKVYGLMHWGDQQVVSHTAGTAASTRVHGTTIGAVGSSHLYLKAASTGTLKAGDLITITTAAIAYQYVVTADVAAVDTTAAGIEVLVSPPVQVTHVAGDTWIQAASHSANIGCQRNAYGLAIRPLDTAALGLGEHVQMTDDVTGLSLCYSLIPEYMQNSIQVSILYGHGALRPGWLVRLLGITGDA